MPQQVSYKTYGGSAAENYERYFVPTIGLPCATDLVRTAALRPGERVLDVACGTGVVTRLARRDVGPAGTVAGADLNPGMLTVARAATPPELDIEWHQAAAEDLPFKDGSFHAVLCQLGLQFFLDKPAALREMWRVLARPGRVAIHTVGPAPGLFTVMETALAQHLAPEAGGFVRVVFSLHDHREIRQLVEQAGFSDASVRSDTKVLGLPAPADFLWQYVYCTPLAAAADGLDDERRAAVERDVVAGWQPYAKNGGLELRVTMVTATGRK